MKLKCSHVFHYDCVVTRLRNRWEGSDVNLKFTQCPLCNQKISAFFKEWNDTQMIQELGSLRQHIRHLIVNQASKSSITIPHPEDSEQFLEEGLRLLNFYDCYKCHAIYFGGLRECGVDTSHVPREEYICGSCRNTCENHGEEDMVYKCRFCCKIASFFCFGHTHFCEDCHPRAFELLQGSNPEYMKSSVPQCPGKDECPLKIDHPPNGEQFAIGCAVCNNTVSPEPTKPIQNEKEPVSNPPVFQIEINLQDNPIPLKRVQKRTRKKRKPKK